MADDRLLGAPKRCVQKNLIKSTKIVYIRASWSTGEILFGPRSWAPKFLSRMSENLSWIGSIWWRRSFRLVAQARIYATLAPSARTTYRRLVRKRERERDVTSV